MAHASSTVSTPPGFIDILRDVLATSPSVSPHALADEVIEKLTVRQIREALTLTLPEYVRREMSHVRSANRKDDADEPKADPYRRVRAQAQAWRDRVLADRDLGETYKPFGEFTLADLKVAAERRFTLAQANQIEGDKYAALAAALEQCGGETVADLDTATLRGILLGSAA